MLNKTIKKISVLLAGLLLFGYTTLLTIYAFMEISYGKIQPGALRSKVKDQLCWCIKENKITFDDIPSPYNTGSTEKFKNLSNRVFEYKLLGSFFPFVVLYSPEETVLLVIPVYE